MHGRLASDGWHHDHMTSATEPHVEAGARNVRLSVSVAVVAAVALAHLVTAFFVDPITSSIIDVVDPLLGAEVAKLAVSLAAWAPLALAALLCARTSDRGWAAALVVVGVATLSYLRGFVAERLLHAGEIDAAVRFFDWSTWVLTCLLPLGAALAWSIARRRGSGWWPGLLVAAALAASFRWLDLTAFGDSDLRFAFAAMVYHVVPAVLAGLVCWWLDSREAEG
jgi:hypothetical protein